MTPLPCKPGTAPGTTRLANLRLLFSDALLHIGSEDGCAARREASMRRIAVSLAVVLLVACSASADIPSPDGSPRPVRPIADIVSPDGSPRPVRPITIDRGPELLAKEKPFTVTANSPDRWVHLRVPRRLVKGKAAAPPAPVVGAARRPSAHRHRRSCAERRDRGSGPLAAALSQAGGASRQGSSHDGSDVPGVRLRAVGPMVRWTHGVGTGAASRCRVFGLREY